MRNRDGQLCAKRRLQSDQVELKSQVLTALYVAAGLASIGPGGIGVALVTDVTQSPVGFARLGGL